MLDTVANVLQIAMVVLAAIGLVWRHREVIWDKLDLWFYEVYCFIFNPGKKGRDAKATLNVVAVARIRMKHNPYSGEWETSRVDFDKD